MFEIEYVEVLKVVRKGKTEHFLVKAPEVRDFSSKLNVR